MRYFLIVDTYKEKMSNPKVKGKKSNISGPYGFRHDLHLSSKDIVVTPDDNKSLSPPPPCLGSKDSSGAFSIPDETLSEQLLAEIIPAIRKETEDIYERKFQALLDKLDKLTSVLNARNTVCSKCACSELQVNFSHEDTAQSLDRFSDNHSEPETVRNDIRRYLNNPLYPLAGGDTSLYLPIITTEKLVKYGSDLHLVPTGSLKLQTEVLQRRNTMPVNQSFRVDHVNRSGYEFTTRRGVSRDNPDERECLADALQKNVVEIVNDVIFNDSELPDCLLEDGCLTENESIRCRKQADPKDQVRMLLSLIKGRDYGVLKCFLKQIKSHNEHIGLIIENQFNLNVKQGLKSTACALCKLKQRVDLKYIADVLYKNVLLEDGLYNVIFQTEKPVGAQDDIWYEVIYWLNGQCKERKDFVKNVLNEALVKKNHYRQLAQEIERLINKEHELVCQCRMKVLNPFCNLSLVSSRSPASSITDNTDSVSIKTESEPSTDAESREKLNIRPTITLKPELHQADHHHDEKTNPPESQHKTITSKPVKLLVAEFQKKTSEMSTDAIKLTSVHPEKSKFKPVELKDKNDSSTSDKEHKVVNSYIRNKHNVLELNRKGIHNLAELKASIV